MGVVSPRVPASAIFENWDIEKGVIQKWLEISTSQAYV